MLRAIPTAAAALLLVGCSATTPPASVAAVQPPPMEEEAELSAGEKILHWPVQWFLDLYDVFDLNLGTARHDYPLGAHAQLTKLVRFGVLDVADFELFGINHALHSRGDFSDWLRFDPGAGDYKVGAMLGAGAGAHAAIDLYEIFDWVTGIVTLNLVNPAGDHTAAPTDDAGR